MFSVNRTQAIRKVLLHIEIFSNELPIIAVFRYRQVNVLHMFPNQFADFQDNARYSRHANAKTEGQRSERLASCQKPEIKKMRCKYCYLHKNVMYSVHLLFFLAKRLCDKDKYIKTCINKNDPSTSLPSHPF